MTISVTTYVHCAFCGHQLVDCQKIGYVETHMFVHPCTYCFPESLRYVGRWPHNEAIEEVKRQELYR